MSKTKIKHKLVFIKILPSSLLGNLLAQSWHGLDEGEITQAVWITDEMRERAKKNGGDCLGPGYIIPGWGFCHKVHATTDITDKDYKNYIKKQEIAFKKKIKEKKEIDESLNRRSRELLILRKQRKAVKNK